MPVTILPTKLSIPPPRKDRVPRSRLTEALSAGIHRQLTLISAPAGFGKSTLVSDWLTGWKGRAAWISLDEGDGEISSFLSYLVAALEPITGRGDELLELARSPQSSPESITTSLIGDLNSANEEIAVVLDDYHLVDSEAVDGVLQSLVDHLPRTVHLVIATREDPELGLSRLRARDELTEIRVSDLRFDTDESRQFLNQVMQLDLPPHAIKTLEDRTEGWAAGIQLAALSMRGAAEREQFVAAFSGSNRYVLDYLVDDVLDRLPQDIRKFLDSTSILDRFSPDLCDAVTGRTDSAAVIEYLDRANLFVVALDSERGWYRYHHLFLDLLRNHAESHEETRAELHGRASSWFSRNGLPLDAFAHAVSAGDTDRAAEILDGDGLPLHYRGTFAPIERWLTSLTPEDLEQRPGLRIACAWVLTTRGAPVAEVNTLLNAAEETVSAMHRGADRDDLHGQIAAIRALLAIPQAELAPIISNAQTALDLLDRRNRPVRTTVAWSLGYAHQMLGELEPAREAFAQSISDGQASGNLVITIGATISLGQIFEAENRLQDAMTTYQAALRLAGDPPLPYACAAYLGLANVQYERNDLDAAGEAAEMAREIGRRLENVDTPGMAALLEARVSLAQGDQAAAGAAVETAKQIFRDRGIEHRNSDLADILVAIEIERGQLVPAMRVAREYDLTDRIAQLLLLEGDPRSALDTLGTYVETDNRADLQANLTSHIIAAAAYWAKGDTDQALDNMARILAAAEREGNVRSFVDLGQPVLALLRASGIQSRFPAYTQTLIGAFGAPGICEVSSESLSNRELEVLTLIADGLSNREIGDRLFIALDTVKGHTRRIYEKLNVNRRTEAVAKATEIGLL